MKKNKNLTKAKKAKNDEFYTQLSDIEKELKHYREYFKGKVIYCNADDPYESNFFKYFAMNFTFFGLKKLIATSYAKSKRLGGDIPINNIKGLKNWTPDKGIKIEINEVKDYNGDTAINLFDVEWLLENNSNTATALKGDGDFRSPECVELLKESDIVVTNPPFSLFREYIAQLVEYNKQFIVMGNFNAVTYKEIFSLIKDEKIWLGYNNNKTMEFRLADDYKEWKRIDEKGNKYSKVPSIAWFTNLPVKKRKEDIILFRKYYDNEEDYPKYDNYDAIEVSKVMNIPEDYYGVMGVPITFLDKYNPDQFEIIWTTDRGGDGFLEHIKLPYNRYDAPVINGNGLYKRILIKCKVKKNEE